MDDIGKKCRPKVQRKVVNLLPQRPLYESHQPIDHIVLEEGRDDSILD